MSLQAMSLAGRPPPSSSLTPISRRRSTGPRMASSPPPSSRMAASRTLVHASPAWWFTRNGVLEEAGERLAQRLRSVVGPFANEQGLDLRPQVREEGGTAGTCCPLHVARGIDAGADAHCHALA